MTMTSPPPVTSAADPYRPGACNIGQAEIARRRRVGILGVAAAVALAAGLLVAGAPPLARLLVALPLASGAIGPLGAEERVADAAAHRADLRKAALVTLAAVALGAAGAVAFLRLPV